MAVTAIIGAQWGDEGKGKVIDALSPTSDIVIRFNGGNNAGHTVVNEFGTFPLHLIPSGIFSQKAIGCITNGVVLDLAILLEEIDLLKKAGINLENRLYISPRCHLIMPYHKILDGLYEQAKGKSKTGTTGRGIGPAYADKVSYNGIRVADLLVAKQFEEKLTIQLAIKNQIITALQSGSEVFPYRKHSKVKNRVMQAITEEPLNQQEIIKQFSLFRKKIAAYIKEPFPLIQDAIKKNKRIMLEGAQATFLDTDWGTYPFATASTIVAGGVTAYAGVAPKHITDVIGVVKAYTTRVGAGPFPTELLDKTGDKLREIGGEFGTTTGRPRRCGWFDAELIRFAAQLNGFTSLAITKLDVLDEFDEIQLCTGYTFKGKSVHYYDGDAKFLEKIKPVYKTMKGWKSSTKGLTTFENLPANAKAYIKEIEKQTGVKVQFISTGKAEELTEMMLSQIKELI